MPRSARRLQSSPKEATMRNPSPVPVTAARESRETNTEGQGSPPEPVSAAENPAPAPRADSPAEAQGRRTLSTAFVMDGSRRTSDGGAARRPHDRSSRRGHAPQGLLRRAGARWLGRHPILRRIWRHRGGPARCPRIGPDTFDIVTAKGSAPPAGAGPSGLRRC